VISPAPMREGSPVHRCGGGPAVGRSLCLDGPEQQRGRGAGTWRAPGRREADAGALSRPCANRSRERAHAPASAGAVGGVRGAREDRFAYVPRIDRDDRESVSLLAHPSGFEPRALLVVDTLLGIEPLVHGWLKRTATSHASPTARSGTPRGRARRTEDSPVLRRPRFTGPGPFPPNGPRVALGGRVRAPRTFPALRAGCSSLA